MTSTFDKELSRKTFVKGGGALIVGFSSLASAAAAGKAQAADSPYASNGPFNQFQIDSWIAINADNTASIKTGGILQGTGSDTGLLMIAGEELDMEMSQLIFVPADTNVTPATGKKSASSTIKRSGPGVRAAAAWARQTLLGLAATQLAVPAAQLSVSKGIVSGGGKTVSYGQLLGGKLFSVEMPASYNLAPTATYGFNGAFPTGQSPSKPVTQYKLVGTSPPRIDIPDMVTGATIFIQNVTVPGMLHGRVVRPSGQAVFGHGAPVVSVDESSIKHIKGARLIRKGDFLGVVAPTEYAAIQAATQLKVKWADPPKTLPGSANEFAGMRALDSAGKSVQSYRINTGNVDAAMASAAYVVSGSYGWPSNMHTPIGAQCTVADVTPQGARILTGTQGAHETRQSVAPVIGMPESKVRVTAFPMGGCFGDGVQYYDTAQAAALMSQVAGKPVRVQLMRWSEISWGSTAPGALMDVRAGIDAKGNLVAFDFTHFYPQYRSEAVQTTDELTGTPLPAVPSSVSGVFPPTPMYRIPNNRYLLKSLPLKDNWVKAHWFRAGSSPHTAFAAEQVIDELAKAVNMDPVAFRIQNVTQTQNLALGEMRDQLLAVMNATTKAAKWQPRVAASNLSSANVVSGRGVAWSNADNNVSNAQTAAIADVEVNKSTGKITVKHVYQAVSTGLAVYPEGIENQIVGGVTQILSRMLVEQYRYSKARVTSSDFVTYPILRFKDTPKVTPMVIQWTEGQPLGVGEPVALAAAAAVANGFYDATGVRLRTAPLTPARVRAALRAAKAV